MFKVRAGNIKRKPMDDRWNYFDLMRVKGTPWDPMARSGKEGGVDSSAEPPQHVRVELPGDGDGDEDGDLDGDGDGDGGVRW